MIMSLLLLSRRKFFLFFYFRIIYQRTSRTGKCLFLNLDENILVYLDFFFLRNLLLDPIYIWY